MRIGRYHLTYCTNIHPGERWDEVQEALVSALLPIRARVAGEAWFGVGLRLSARAAASLAQPAELARFRDFLTAHRLYVFTINGFPYGSFYGRAVKEQVYRPDWLEEARLEYTTRLATLLEALLPDDAPALAGSISTLPGAFRTRLATPAHVARLVAMLVRQAARLHALYERRGRRLVLALEPEPCCYLETTTETLRFFEQELFSPRACAQLAALTGLSYAAAEEALRRHLGICLDTCHVAVQFESPVVVLRQFRAAGVHVAKIQLSAGLVVESPRAKDRARALKAFAESVYLHQVVERSNNAGEYRRYTDLPLALQAPAESGAACCWRVHFHVPLFSRDLGPFQSTQADVEELLEGLVSSPEKDCPHLEVETYSWQVLPAAYRSPDVVTDVSRELQWVLKRLAPGRSQA